jgi:NAD(P)-dependent dehydrogenase (short-subunit alcohol dehydrogenase family)
MLRRVREPGIAHTGDPERQGLQASDGSLSSLEDDSLLFENERGYDGGYARQDRRSGRSSVLSLEDLFGLRGKHAAIIGGGLGIGRASAELLSQAGAAVAVVDIERQRAEAVARALEAAGGRAVALSADVLDAPRGAEVLREAADQLGGLEVLVNVVGRSTYKPLLEMDDAHFALDLDRNMGYVFRVCRAFANRLVERGEGGAIVNIASVAGLQGAPGNAGYGAAKAALISLTRSMAVEWAEYGIRVNCVAPGIVATDHWLESRGEAAAGEASRRSATVPLGRLGRQEEVANAVLFLASEMSSYITGQALVLDGGRGVRPPAA